VTVKITHPDKVLFGDDGYTKQDMVDYYASVASVMLTHMKSHPLAMLRFNQGIDGERFFQKQAPDYFPEFIERVDVPKKKGTTRYAVVNNAEALLYIANHNTIEFHVLPVRAEDLAHPDRLVFDLDPSVEDFDAVRDAALALHDLLADIGLSSFVMTSGSRGLHIWVPLDRKSTTGEVVSFASAVAQVLVSKHPDDLTTEFMKADRGSRIYVDIARNAPAQHAVTPYSLRAKPHAPVATPIDWSDVRDPALTPTRHTMRDVPARIAKDRDPWDGMRRAVRSLAKPAKAVAVA
jgi:bifunctional non-homologous end joining protein LigD